MTGTYTPGLTSERDHNAAELENHRALREKHGTPYEVAPDLPTELRKAAHRFPELRWLLQEAARQIDQAEYERFCARTK